MGLVPPNSVFINKNTKTPNRRNKTAKTDLSKYPVVSQTAQWTSVPSQPFYPDRPRERERYQKGGVPIGPDPTEISTTAVRLGVKVLE